MNQRATAAVTRLLAVGVSVEALEEWAQAAEERLARAARGIGSEQILIEDHADRSGRSIAQIVMHRKAVGRRRLDPQPLDERV